MIYVLKISGKETKMVCRDIKKMKNRERSKNTSVNTKLLHNRIPL